MATKFQPAMTEVEQIEVAAEVAEYEAMVESGLFADEPTWASLDIDIAFERHLANLTEWHG